ncbi:MAG: helix-turn-helix domain-containing protein [Erysipelotrichia bacterium]|nr:helix-turn-helix domain-containing protein [Erysipelotrichia bacterium]
MEIAEILMNPVRQRIFQYLLTHQKGTVKEMAKVLTDVAPASLYRNVKLLADNNILKVCAENRIRGTIEKIYIINEEALNINDQGKTVQMALLRISASFAKYFAKENNDPQKDMLLLSVCTLNLDDEDFRQYLAEINTITIKYVNKKVNDNSKVRQVTMISSPVEEETNE